MSNLKIHEACISEDIQSQYQKETQDMYREKGSMEAILSGWNKNATKVQELTVK